MIKNTLIVNTLNDIVERGKTEEFIEAIENLDLDDDYNIRTRLKNVAKPSKYKNINSDLKKRILQATTN